jgi:CubicO group peptidase (beta-lactamase class C family)
LFNSLFVLILCSMLFLPEQASSAGLPSVPPREVGLNYERFLHLDNLLRDYVERGELAGVIGVVARRGRIAHFFKHGVRDIASGKPLRDDSIFRIYSMTKPVASVAVMILWERGLFQLDDPVERYIPEFGKIKVIYPERGSNSLLEPENKITVKQLLTHTAALNYNYPEGSELQSRYRDLNARKHDLTLKQWTQHLAEFPVTHQPGTKWQYSSPSTDVLGYLVEVLSGQRFDVFLQQEIFEPLGMKDTGFHVPSEKVERFTAMYGPPAKAGEELTLLEGIDASRYTAGPATFFSGSGGLVSTAGDYIRFAQMMLNGGELDGTKILSRKTVELISANHLRPEMIPFGFNDPRLAYVTRGWGFGLGYAVLLDVPLHGMAGSIGTFKWAGAANTDHWIDPQEELIGLLLTQFMPNGHYPVDRQFRNIVYQAIAD